MGVTHPDAVEPGLEEEPARRATFEKDGQVVGPQVEEEEPLPQGLSAADAFLEGLTDDTTTVPRGHDVSGLLTASGEASELVFGDRQGAEMWYRQALRAGGTAEEAHQSLRRLHRSSGNWRTVLQIVDQEFKRSDDVEHKAGLALMRQVLVRTRKTSLKPSQTLEIPAGMDLPEVYGRAQRLLEASEHLAEGRVAEALRLRRGLAAMELEVEGDGTPLFDMMEVDEYQEWTWSEANLTRFLLDDSRRAMELLLGVFESGRRDPQLLEALAELLTEHAEWDRLKRVYASAVEAGTAAATDYEAYASLLQHKFRDLPGATEVLLTGSKAYPEDATLSRRLVDLLQLGTDHEALIDALGNLIDVTVTPERRADLLCRIGTLFEDGNGMTSAAIEVLHEAIATSPHHAGTLRRLGRIYTRQRNWYGLADLYEKELAAPAPLPEAWRRHFRLAEIYDVRLKNSSAALRHYKTAMAMQPDFRPAMDAIVEILSKEGEWEQLVRFLMNASHSLSSTKRRIYGLHLAANVAEHHMDSAVVIREVYTRLLQVDPESMVAFKGLARALREGQAWDELIDLYLREASVCQETTETATLFWMCGQVARDELNDTRRAEGYYQQAISLEPDFTPALEALGNILWDERRFEELVALTEGELEVLEDLELRTRRLDDMADVLDTRMHRRAAAIETYERIIEEAPEHTSALSKLRGLYAEQGKWELVADLLEREAAVVDHDVERAQLFYQLGEVRERRLGEPASALDAYAACLSAEPNHAHGLRAVLRVGQSQPTDVMTVVNSLRDAVEAADGRRLILRHLARAAETKSGDPAAGMEFRRNAVAEDPEDREARDLLEAAFAASRDLPGLAGLWATAGRTVDEGLLGLLALSAGISSSALLSAFLGRWGSELEERLRKGGRLALFEAALAELSRAGLLVVAEQAATIQAPVPDSVLRRAALAALADENKFELARTLVSAEGIEDPGALRLRLHLAETDEERIKALRADVAALSTSELRAKRFLELAEVDKASRDRHLADAVRLEAYNSPVQDELYERLEEAGEFELLRKALEEHLCSDALSVAKRSKLAYSLGCAIEALEEDKEDALAAYRMSFQSGHDRHEALIAMARLTEELGDKWDAIKCLEAFMTLSDDTTDRLDAGLHLADLYLSEATSPEEQESRGYDPYAGPVRFDGGPFGRKALELLARLREEARGHEEERVVVSRLAYANARVGSPYRAVELLQEVLAESNGAEEIEDTLALADLYATSLGDLENARHLVTGLFERHPEREEVLEQLLELGRSGRTLHAVCARIEHVARHADRDLLNAERRRELIKLVADIYSSELGRYREAAGLWEELADRSPDAATTRTMRARQAAALCRVAGEEARCHGLLTELHEEDPYDLAPYEGLEVLYGEIDDVERLRTVRSIRYLLDKNAGELPADGVRRKYKPSRPFKPQDLEDHLLPEGLRGGVLGVLQALEPLAVKIWGEHLPTLDALGGKKWKPGTVHEQVHDFVGIAGDTFSIPRAKLFLADGGPGTPHVFNGATQSLWFNRQMFEDVGAEVGRFLVGYSAGLAWSKVSSLVHLDGRDLWHLLEAALIKQTGVGLTDVTDPRSMELAEKVSGAFNRSHRKRITEAAASCMDLLRDAHCEAWPSLIQSLATRAGLVVSNQVSGALQTILASRQWRGQIHEEKTQRFMRKLPEVADILRFALSEDYLALRYACGLSARASGGFAVNTHYLD